MPRPWLRGDVEPVGTRDELTACMRREDRRDLHRTVDPVDGELCPCGHDADQPAERRAPDLAGAHGEPGRA